MSTTVLLTDKNNNILHRVISFSPTNPPLQSTSVLRQIGMTELCRLVYYVCGEDVNVQDDHDGDTPLHRACYSYADNSDGVGALLLAGADETITNDDGRIPIQYGCGCLRRVEVLPLLDVSSEWKSLVRSHRLRRRTAVRVMMTLVKWKVQQTRSMWTRAVMTLHTIITCTLSKIEANDESRDCCWQNFRKGVCAVTCCFNTRGYTRLDTNSV
jgi:hypothetical protein